MLASVTKIFIYLLSIENWNNITAKGNIPPPRIHHTATLLSDGHTIAVIGGETFNSTGDYILNDVYLLDTNTWTWSAPNIQGEGLARSNHTSVLIDGKVWVLAGTNTTAKAVDIQILNVTGWFWTFDHTSNYVAPQRYASVGGVGGIVGIVIGCIVAVAIAFIAFFFWKRRNNRRRNLTAHNTKDMSGTMIYPEVKTVYHNDTVNELQVASKMPSFTEDWNGQQINNTGYFRRSYDHNQGSVHSFHEASYYTEDGYVPQTIGPKSYKEDTSRPISTYWDENSHYQQYVFY